MKYLGLSISSRTKIQEQAVLQACRLFQKYDGMLIAPATCDHQYCYDFKLFVPELNLSRVIFHVHRLSLPGANLYRIGIQERMTYSIGNQRQRLSPPWEVLLQFRFHRPISFLRDLNDQELEAYEVCNLLTKINLQ